MAPCPLNVFVFCVLLNSLSYENETGSTKVKAGVWPYRLIEEATKEAFSVT